ncbi:MAG TPA: radical SAM protein, partial [Candidatus Margulisiibacteriota bacterium]|nr:radical SAM protein [Candidatus Margulisiibacteriota bacterium]
NGEVIRNPSIPLANRLDDYPIPDYDLTHQYIGESGRLVPMRPSPSHIQFEDFVVLGSRGCPHQCSYCSNQRLKSNFPWLKEVRHYSVGYLMEHLKRVHSLFPGIRSFWIEDDTFFAKESEAIGEFAKRYKNEVGKPFYVLISPWTYSEEKLKLLIDAGLYKIIMGIQSGSDNTNANIYNRVLSSERIMKIALSLNGYSGLKVCYDFIGLNPFEKQSDLIETIKFIRKLPAPFYIFNNNLAFYPGTRLYERAVGEGLDISRRLKHAGSHQGYILLKYEKMRHKIFHFLLLLLSGSGNIWRIGKVPRFLLSETSITLYRCMDNRISDWVVSRLSALLIYMEWKKMIKRLLGPRLVSLIKLKLYYKLKYRPQNLNVYV